jgi:DNA polymerase IV
MPLVKWGIGSKAPKDGTLAFAIRSSYVLTMFSETWARPKPGKGQDSACLGWLFLDLNSYFASVEQQIEPRLRGKPVIVTPVDSDATCAIATSYEARRFGIKTGTKVYEAKRMCPGLIAVPARHDVYVEFHHRIVNEVERHLHVTRIDSIDEVACELMGAERLTENAVGLAREVQAGILKNVGDVLRSSVGLAPSALLAKIASDMQKPAGLTVLGADRLPEAICALPLTDLAGIGRNMKLRLQLAGIFDVASFWALSPSQARAVWGGIQGERFWYALHGIDPPEIATKRQSISHSHVLGPDLRNAEAAHRVVRKLVARAASRLRRAGFKTGRLVLWLKTVDGAKREAVGDLTHTADTFALLAMLESLWREIVGPDEAVPVRHIGIVLIDLIEIAVIATDLFGWRPDAGERPDRLRLSEAIDRLNLRYGRDAVAIGTAPQCMSRYTGAKIAFNRVPERKDFS